MPPIEMIEKYSADAVRYWAASTGPGKDTIISEEKIQIGIKLVNKLWNVARFSSPFIDEYRPFTSGSFPQLSPADKWILSRTQKLIQRVTSHFNNYDYAAAKAETEAFIWSFADNYLEMAKQRLYDQSSPLRKGAQFTLYHVLLTLLKLFAPILPYVTEYIYQGIYAENRNTEESPMAGSIHKSNWPVPDDNLIDDAAEGVGELLVDIAIQVRRYKSERNLSLGTELSRVKLSTENIELVSILKDAVPDLRSITRVAIFEIDRNLDPDQVFISPSGDINLEIDP
jgi:valyl-tRNA synthetase